jgi:hypothetical protein
VAKTLSGPAWVRQFPTSTSVEDLVDPFQSNAKKFIAALRKAGATVSIGATLRPKERAWLMHWSFEISKGFDPGKVPAMTGVDIEWVHRDAKGNTDLSASKAAADAMVLGYEILFEPALVSRHTAGLAIDMDIGWSAKGLIITDLAGKPVTIGTNPKDGRNTDLHRIGASYGVIKLVTDPPHWSNDGH